MIGVLRDLVVTERLAGAVLLTFDGERVGVTSYSPEDKFDAVLGKLGELFLTDFNDRRYDQALDAGEPRH